MAFATRPDLAADVGDWNAATRGGRVMPSVGIVDVERLAPFSGDVGSAREAAGSQLPSSVGSRVTAVCEHCFLGDELAGLDRRGFIVASGAGLVSVLFRPEVASAARRFELICKGAWGARPPTGDFRHHEIVRVTIHHSAVALRDNRDAPRHLRGHQRYHQSLGWPDIAYHAIVDRHGNVYKGRPFAARGDSATEYDTRGHLLVMCEGDFDSQRVSRAQLRALVDVVAWGCAAFEVAPRRIRGHRDYADTACPGGHLGRLIDDGTIRAAVRGRLRHGGVEKVRLCGAAGRRRVRAIERGTD